MVAGDFLRNAIYKVHLKQVVNWAAEHHKREIKFVDDWDPELQKMRQFRVLQSVDDAEPGEEYFQEMGGGMVFDEGDMELQRSMS